MLNLSHCFLTKQKYKFSDEENCFEKLLLPPLQRIRTFLFQKEQIFLRYVPSVPFRILSKCPPSRRQVWSKMDSYIILSLWGSGIFKIAGRTWNKQCVSLDAGKRPSNSSSDSFQFHVRFLSIRSPKEKSRH